MEILRFCRYVVYGVLGLLSAYFATVYATALAVLPFVVVYNALSVTARIWILVVVPVALMLVGGAVYFFTGVAGLIHRRIHKH